MKIIGNERIQGYKCYQLSKNGRKWLEMAENGFEIDENGQKLLEIAWPENVMLNTSVMCRVIQLLLWPEKCKGG